MILIAESGSTKCDWSLIYNRQVEECFYTKGINPFYNTKQQILNRINDNKALIQFSSQISTIHFLGSGCSSIEKQNIVKSALQIIFPESKITVSHDLLGAAYATYQGSPAITAILGTGSNACLFDGIELSQKKPSLGFIMGDEGSGSYFGKKLIAAHCYGELDQTLSKNLAAFLNMDCNQLIHRVNSEPNANVFLASTMPFIAQHRENSFMRNMLFEGMERFLKTHLLPFKEATHVNVNFVGSVAYYFKDILIEICKQNNLSIGLIIQKPGKRIADYYIKFGEI